MDNGPRNSGGKMSLMDIQAEQERERSYGNNNRRGSRSSYNSNNNNNNSGNNNNNNNYHRSSSGGGGGGRRGSRRGSDRSSLPLERGCICSLKEKFGFIHCADRPNEIFFHYSEVTSPHPDHLQIDDEVEFRVGKSRDNPDKLAALEVVQLPTGSIEWEYEETPGKRFQGIIDRPLMRSGSGSNGRNNSDNNNNK
ncbi:shock domain-containing protein E1 [Seminavis robusta]|uniref:Shock domain-containing protein E1 n=1 Tax=Seminavis robusta TaxID=568900 RepID=A0A9N8EYW9_9STRA|nr:shock domain-containing protein E1 [Seminavis robusta]|eukprot:Sro2151_g316700.1 shock domain-containing protein E1 (195) ;mRNA; f:6271-6855